MTVADDLLKNDGQKFLEMMEQLAERRMQREEEAAVDVEDDSEDEDDEGDEDEDECGGAGVVVRCNVVNIIITNIYIYF